MSDVEEPPTKMSKYEEYLEDGEEGLEEGQEEWLSEGVLTDDDYHISTAEQDKTNSSFDNKSQDDQDMVLNMQGLEETADQSNGTEKAKTDQNIEDTLNNLDGKNNLPEDLDTFLIRKPEGKSTEAKEQQYKEDKAKEDDDGNDTDDLLVNNSSKRLLEDDQQVKKKAIKIIKSDKTQDPGSSDDEFIYERSKVKTLKLAKNALIKRVPSKAVPEQSDTDDESSGDEIAVKRIFGVKGPDSKSTSKNSENPKKMIKHVVQVNSNYYKSKPPPPKSAVKHTPSKSKTDVKTLRSTENKPAPSFKTIEKNNVKIQKTAKSEPKETAEEKNINPEELDEIIDEEEFLEEDDFELDEEEFGEESEGEITKKQRIMRPEVMDEEVPSDEESHSEDGSLYDELPSSDSEDFDDWFTLDIRSERASDYLPLLGGCARALLAAERRRCAARVATLRHSLSALTDSARRQADALRRAAMALAELDDTLRAA